MPEKKLLMLLDLSYPGDARVKKEAEALIAAGYQLYLVCERKDSSQAETEVLEGIHITRVQSGKKWFAFMGMGFSNIPFKKAALPIIKKENIRLLHVNDLPMMSTGIHIRRSTGVTLVADFHENFPEAMKTWFAWNKGFFLYIKRSLFFGPKRWFRRERKACAQADHILAVVEEMKDRLIKDHGVESSKITVVTNTETVKFVQAPNYPDIYKEFEGKFVLTYSGGLGPHRGIDTAIKGMQYLKDQSDIQLVIIGSGNKAVETHLKNLVKQYELQNVHFLGYFPSAKMYSTMHYTGVNIIPHVSNGHTDNTIPHKLFQGMMSGRPLLVSSSSPLKRYMDMTQAGLVFEAGNAKDFADKTLALYNSPGLCTQLAANGMKATLQNDLNWEHTQKILTGLYDRLLGIG